MVVVVGHPRLVAGDGARGLDAAGFEQVPPVRTVLVTSLPLASVIFGVTLAPLTPAKLPSVPAAVTWAKDLTGALLLAHGLADDNVHAQNTWRMVDALVAAGRRFDLQVYPRRGHGIEAQIASRDCGDSIGA